MRKLLIASVALLALTISPALVADSVPPITDPRSEELSAMERVEVLIERVKQEQEKIETLSARFSQLQESEFLMEPEESLGRFYYAAPDRVLWEYSAPDPVTVLVADGTMTSWYRDLNRAEKLQVGHYSTRVLEYMGAGGSVAALQEYFDVTAAFPDDRTEPYRLELTPRYARIEKRLREIKIWVDPVKFLPQRLRYVDGSGDVTEFRFEELTVNSELSADRFDLELPSTVEVKVVDLDRDS